MTRHITRHNFAFPQVTARHTRGAHEIDAHEAHRLPPLGGRAGVGRSFDRFKEEPMKAKVEAELERSAP